MYSVEVSVEISTAHRLMTYQGDCSRLHGHNYHITARLTTPRVESSQGMVVDMKTLKAFLKEAVGSWDHATLLNEEDPLIKALDGMVIHTTPGDPTAETMARMIHEKLSFKFPAYAVLEIRVRETEKSEACYYVHREDAS